MLCLSKNNSERLTLKSILGRVGLIPKTVKRQSKDLPQGRALPRIWKVLIFLLSIYNLWNWGITTGEYKKAVLSNYGALQHRNNCLNQETSNFGGLNSVNMGGSSIKIISFNTQGIQTRGKRKKVFHWLKKKKANLYLLQETHSTLNDELNWRGEWGADIYYSHGDSESRGVAIGFNIPFDHKVNDAHRDREGRYIILDMDINSVRCLIVNVYAPNSDDAEFFANLIDKIQSLGCLNVIWGGDFNLVHCVEKDKKGGNKSTHIKCRDKVFEWMSDSDSVDIWRRLHPMDRQYTWFSNRRPKRRKQYYADHNLTPEFEFIACRLDFFLITFQLQQNVSRCDILAGYHSDHSLVKLVIDINPISKGRGFWKLNCSLLKESEYINKITQTVANTLLENPNTEERLLWEQIKCNIRRDSISYSFRRKRERDNLLETLEKRKLELQAKVVDNPLEKHRVDLSEVSQDIEEIVNHQAEGAAMRARATYYEQGERSTKYFHSLESKNSANKYITCIENAEHQQIQGIKNVLLE